MITPTHALIAVSAFQALWLFVLTIRSSNTHRRLSALELSKGIAQEYIVRESNLVEPKGKHPGQSGLGAFPTRRTGEWYETSSSYVFQ
jgi:hypothetical protein